MPIKNEAKGEKIKCPKCGSLDTYADGDGTATKWQPAYWHACKRCRYSWS